MANRNPLPGLIINGLTAGIPAIVEAVKAGKEKKALKAAQKIAEAANGQLTAAVTGATVLNAPELLIPELPPEILDSPLWLQGLWIGFAASGFILRIVAHIMQKKAERLPQNQQ